MVGDRSTRGVLIVGGNGFLGSHLARSLRGNTRVVTTYLKNRVPIEGVLSLPIDVRDANGMKRMIYTLKPDCVVYLGGSEDPAWVESNSKIAEKIFSSGAGEVLHSAEMVGSKFIYVSTASVFDGTKGNYKETDNVSPMTLLGKLKAGGENVVRGRSSQGTILRLSALVGSAHPWRPSVFDQIRRDLQQKSRIEFSDDEYHSWLPVSAAVQAIEAVIEKSAKGSLYHIGGLTRLTPYEIARLFARTFKFDEELILRKKKTYTKGMPTLPGGERLDFSLNSSELIRTFGIPSSAIEETIEKEFQFI